VALALQIHLARRLSPASRRLHEVAMTRILRWPATATRRAALLIHAPGKQHRHPPPSLRGARHSDERIAKAKLVGERRRWARD
jgi:hypothetical protein